MSRGGEDYPLRSGDYTAAVTQVGAGVRVLRHASRDLLLGYAGDQIRPKFRGALLAPWPNRVVDGTYSFAGTTHQLDLTEPERGHALHGLVAWERFQPVERDEASIRLRHRIVPRTGWPFQISVDVRYVVDDSGLRCTVTARNDGTEPAPYGVGPHPYLLAGPGRVDEWRFELPAAQVLQVTPDRLVPRELTAVEDTGLDFRGGRPIGSDQVDHAYTALRADADGLVRARATADDGSGVECVWDPVVLPWVQVHTADLPEPEESRRGLAVEPMTCPPDALNSGTDLVVLDPGEEHVAGWRIAAL